MYFSYGRDRREGVSSASTFDAILAGERTSTTRFPAWGGYSRWEAMKPGEKVRFFEDREMRGRFVDVRVTGVEPLDQIGRASCRERVCQYVSLSVGAGSL